MKILVISDHYIPEKLMTQGLVALESLGMEIEVRRWEHSTLEELQEANLKIEQGGPGAVPLPAEITRDIDSFDIIVVQFAPVSQSLIEAATNLKIIGVLRSGVENIDMKFAKERGITVLNTPGRNARAVAETTLGLILAEIKNIARGHQQLKSGNWTRDYPNQMEIPELLDKTVGLVGFGAIGRLVAKYLLAFDANVIVHDPFYQGDFPGITAVGLDELMRDSDVVSLHARYQKETHHLINRERLEMMKPTAILVNTARSGLVDEPALADILKQHRIMGAALDVFEDEPLPVDSPFVQLDNVTITPHLAGSSSDAFKNTPKLFAANLIKFLDNSR